MLFSTSTLSIVAMFGLSPAEMIGIGVVAVLLFGSRLPSVARSLGTSFVEFKKGMRGVEDDLDEAVNSEPAQVKQRSEPTAPSSPQFVPPQEAPKESSRSA